jgi:DNA-binding XRE family transcriptional regulator
LRSKQVNLLSAPKDILIRLGKKIKNVRKRRMLKAIKIAEDANIARSTLGLIEKGCPSVSIGAYIQVMYILGFERDLKELTKDIS